MNLTDDFTLKCQIGEPILFEDICVITPPKLREIISLGYSKFVEYLNVLTMTRPTKSMIKDERLWELIKDFNDFQYFLTICSLDKQMNQTAREAFFFFTKEKVTFMLEPAQILFGPLNEKHILDEGKFAEFQHILRRMNFLEQEGDEIIIYEDDSPAVKKLKEQMRENRLKVAKAKAKKNASSKDSLKLSDLIGSITLNDCGLNMTNVGEITYYALHDQLKRMGWRDAFRTNSSVALAGGKVKNSDLKNWIKSINS